MTDSRSTNESNPMSEDTREISGDKGSTNIGPDNSYMNVIHSRQLKEYYTLKQAINIWPGPRHPAFSSLITRVKSFEAVDWPKTCPTPISLAEAGFFYDSELTTF